MTDTTTGQLLLNQLEAAPGRVEMLFEVLSRGLASPVFGLVVSMVMLASWLGVLLLEEVLL